jgi:glycosyltransferase involved in cell wall biosynthesis
MLKVGFFLSSCFPDEYPGGKNYMMNLFYSLSLINCNEIECILFIGKKTPVKYEKDFEPFGKIVRTSFLDRKSIYWFFYKVFKNLFNTHILAYSLLKKYDISILSHSDIYGINLPFKTVNWVPDLQFLHLPELWDEKELKHQKLIFKKRLLLSDVCINSSYDGQKDSLDYVPTAKTSVIRPVYQVSNEVYNHSESTISCLEKKYNFKGRYFYLPNQFWTHKNHMVVFRALNVLRKINIDVLLICTGLMEGADSIERGHPDYMKKIYNYITDNKLNDNIKFLGLIDYDDVLKLGRYSVSIINPSFFEGWSSTVEEAKSIGKNVILSNLEIHLEQDPPGAVFFDPTDHKELAKILEHKWLNSKGGPDFDLEEKAKNNIKNRTIEFGQAYVDLIHNLEKNEF